MGEGAGEALADEQGALSRREGRMTAQVGSVQVCHAGSAPGGRDRWTGGEG